MRISDWSSDVCSSDLAWYVRLWNYASGGPEDAVIALDFSAIRSGFLLAEGEDVWAGDVDRMFISLAAPGYDAGSAAFAAAVEGWCELSEISCDGAGSVLRVGDVEIGRAHV